MKIKWNDDRVRGATTAILLIVRDRLARNDTTNLIQGSLAEYRTDPTGYKQRKANWADIREVGPLTNPQHAAYYAKLIAAADALLLKITREQRQFNSLLELDNFLVHSLGPLH